MEFKICRYYTTNLILKCMGPARGSPGPDFHNSSTFNIQKKLQDKLSESAVAKLANDFKSWSLKLVVPQQWPERWTQSHRPPAGATLPSIIMLSYLLHYPVHR